MMARILRLKEKVKPTDEADLLIARKSHGTDPGMDLDSVAFSL